MLRLTDNSLYILFDIIFPITVLVLTVLLVWKLAVLISDFYIKKHKDEIFDANKTLAQEC